MRPQLLNSDFHIVFEHRYTSLRFYSYITRMAFTSLSSTLFLLSVCAFTRVESTVYISTNNMIMTTYVSVSHSS